ncbi:MAG TPA: hypothetical protein VNO87_03070, partial [Methylomirabilota bacterium]|nr:hypothetical protein [Methylomirabilota bacterium]
MITFGRNGRSQSPECASKYRLSVFSNTQYKPRDGSHDFRNDAEPGDVFELTIKKTKSGNPDLKS